MAHRRKSPVSDDSLNGESDETVEPQERPEQEPTEEPENSPERGGEKRGVQQRKPPPRRKSNEPTPPTTTQGGPAPPGPPPPDDFVVEGGRTVATMPWVLVAAGLFLIVLAWFLWNKDDPTRASAQITRITSKTTAPDAGKAGTTTVDSTEKVVSVTNLHTDDAFQQGVLRGIAQPRQRVYASGADPQGSASAPSGAVGPRNAPDTAPTGASGATGAKGSTGASGASGASGAKGASGASGASGTTGSTGATGKNGSSGSSGATGAQSASTVAASPSKRSESLTLSFVFLGALFILGGAFYSRVTSLEAGPSGVKISLKALHHLKKGVLEAAEKAREAGYEVPPSATVEALAAAVDTTTTGATALAGRPAAVTAARKPPRIKAKDSKVVFTLEQLEDIGRRAFNSTVFGNPDFA